MTTMTRNAQAIQAVRADTGRGLFRVLHAMREQRAQDPERAARRRVGREFAAYPATRGVGLILPYRDAPR